MTNYPTFSHGRSHYTSYIYNHHKLPLNKYLTKGRATQPLFKSLCHGQVAPVGERGLNQLVLYTEILKPVVEVGVGHVDGELLKDVRFLGVKVESHLGEPLEAACVCHSVGDEHSSRVSLVDQLRDLVGGEQQNMTSLQTVIHGTP